MIKIIVWGMILLLLLLPVACTKPAPVYVPVLPQTESAEDFTAVPQPKVWQTLPNEEHNLTLNICCSLVRSRLTSLASSQAAFEYVDSFFTHITTRLGANGADFGSTVDNEGNETKVYCRCPENAWWLMIYGMFPTEETIEAQIDDVTVPMTKYHVPERWSSAVWLIFTDGTVMPYYNEYEKSDAAFKVEEDIAKLNNGIELDYEWRR